MLAAMGNPTTDFSEWYSEEGIRNLVCSKPKQISSLRYVFSYSGDGNPHKQFLKQFLKQFRQLVILKDTFKASVYFISMRPGAVMSSHFIIGIIVDERLIIINPLGDEPKDDLYKTLFKVKDLRLVKSISVSNTVIQNDRGGIISCGPICVELFNHLSTLPKETILKMASGKFVQKKLTYAEEALKSYVLTSGEVRLPYSSIDIAKFLPDKLPALLQRNPEHYLSSLKKIRVTHQALLKPNQTVWSAEHSLVHKMFEAKIEHLEQEEDFLQLKAELNSLESQKQAQSTSMQSISRVPKEEIKMEKSAKSLPTTTNPAPLLSGSLKHLDVTQLAVPVNDRLACTTSFQNNCAVNVLVHAIIKYFDIIPDDIKGELYRTFVDYYSPGIGSVHIDEPQMGELLRTINHPVRLEIVLGPVLRNMLDNAARHNNSSMIEDGEILTLANKFGINAQFYADTYTGIQDQNYQNCGYLNMVEQGSVSMKNGVVSPIVKFWRISRPPHWEYEESESSVLSQHNQYYDERIRCLPREYIYNAGIHGAELRKKIGAVLTGRITVTAAFEACEAAIAPDVRPNLEGIEPFFQKAIREFTALISHVKEGHEISFYLNMWEADESPNKQVTLKQLTEKVHADPSTAFGMPTVEYLALRSIPYNREELQEIIDKLGLASEIVTKVTAYLNNIEHQVSEICKYQSKTNPENFYEPMRTALLEIRNIAKDLHELTKPYHQSLSHQIKTLIEGWISPLEKELTRLEMPVKDREDLELKTRYLYAAQSYIARTLQESFNKHLQGIEKMFSKSGKPKLRCHISYAWPSTANQEKEYWVQPFLTVLYKHLTKAGIRMVMDIRDNKSNDSIYQFMKKYDEGNPIILIGTESLLEKHYSIITHAVQTELSIIANRSGKDQKQFGQSRIYPLLISGTISSAYPEIYDKYRTVRDPRDLDYIAMIKQLIDWLCESEIVKVNEQYNDLWQTFYKAITVLPKDHQVIEQELALGYHRQTLDHLKRDIQYQSVFAQEQTYHSQAVQAEQISALIKSHGTNPQMLFDEHGQQFQRPYRNPDFIERPGLWDKMVQHFAKGDAQILTLTAHGLGGMGKTELAQHYYLHPPKPYTLRAWFHAGKKEYLYYQYIALAAEHPESVKFSKEMSVEEQARKIKQWLESQKDCLLVYDNVSNAKEIEELLPNRGKHHILMTSRNEIDWPSHQKLDVNVMEENEAIALLVKITGLEDREKIKGLVNVLGCLPLALGQAAAYIATKKMDVDEYLGYYHIKQADVLSEVTRRHPRHELVSSVTFNKADGLIHYDAKYEPVWVTFDMNFEALQRDFPAALVTLKQAAWLYCYDIPEMLLQAMITDSSGDKEKLWCDIKEQLSLYSLMRINVAQHQLSIHPLLQDMLRDKQKKGNEIHEKPIEEALYKMLDVFNDAFNLSGSTRTAENLKKLHTYSFHMEILLKHIKSFVDLFKRPAILNDNSKIQAKAFHKLSFFYVEQRKCDEAVDRGEKSYDMHSVLYHNKKINIEELVHVCTQYAIALIRKNTRESLDHSKKNLKEMLKLAHSKKVDCHAIYHYLGIAHSMSGELSDYRKCATSALRELLYAKLIGKTSAEDLEQITSNPDNWPALLVNLIDFDDREFILNSFATIISHLVISIIRQNDLKSAQKYISVLDRCLEQYGYMKNKNVAGIFKCKALLLFKMKQPLEFLKCLLKALEVIQHIHGDDRPTFIHLVNKLLEEIKIITGANFDTLFQFAKSVPQNFQEPRLYLTKIEELLGILPFDRLLLSAPTNTEGSKKIFCPYFLRAALLIGCSVTAGGIALEAARRCYSKP